MKNSKFQEIAITAVKPHPQNPRLGDFQSEDGFQDLIKSIEEKGILTPLIVNSTQSEDGREREYVILAGHRRHAAAVDLGFTSLPALVHDLSDDAAFDLLMLENLNRDDLDPLEECRVIAELKARYKLNDKQAAEKLSKSAAWVRMRQNLLDLPELLKEPLRDHSLALTTAQLVLSLPAELKEAGAELVADQELNFGKPLSFEQAKGVLQDELLEPWEAKKSWDEQRSKVIDAATKELGALSRVELGSPNVRWEELSWRNPSLVAAKDFLNRGEMVDGLDYEGTRWLHLAQKHNAPVHVHCINGEPWLSVDRALIEQSEKVIYEAHRAAHKTLNDPDAGDARRADAEKILKEELWLNLHVKSSAPLSSDDVEEEAEQAQEQDDLDGLQDGYDVEPPEQTAPFQIQNAPQPPEGYEEATNGLEALLLYLEKALENIQEQLTAGNLTDGRMIALEAVQGFIEKTLSLYEAGDGFNDSLSSDEA